MSGQSRQERERTLEGPGGQMLANGLIRLALLKLRVREPMTMNASVRGLPARMAGGKPGLEVGQLGAGAFALRTARGWIGEIKSVWGRIGKIRNVRRRTGSGRALYTHSTLTRSTGHRRWRCSVVFGSGALRKVIRKWLSINRGCTQNVSMCVAPNGCVKRRVKCE